MTEADLLRDDYLQQLRVVLRDLERSQQTEILNEIRCHLNDSAAQYGDDPVAAMAAAIKALGPAVVLGQALLPEAELRAASSGFQPRRMANGLVRSMLGGLRGLLLGLLFASAYMSLLIIAIAVVGKLFVPASGLFMHVDGSWSLSFEPMPNARELLGWWLVPVGSLIVAGGWWLLGWLLRWALRRWPVVAPGTPEK